MPFDFLNTVRSRLSDFFRPEQASVTPRGLSRFIPEIDVPQITSTLERLTEPLRQPPPPSEQIEVEGQGLGEFLLSSLGVGQAPSVGAGVESTALPTPSPAPTDNQFGVPRDQAALEEIITAGLADSNFADAPISTLSGQLAQAGAGLPEAVDPLLPVILSLMETSGGRNLSAPNNLFNIGPGISYPDPVVNILGGGPQDQLGLAGVLRPGGIYDPFLQTGDLSEFFRTFTPETDPANPSNEELVNRFNTLRDIFVQ